MRVDNVTINPNPDPVPAQTSPVKPNPASTESAGGSTSATSGYAPTSALLQLLTLARQTPEVRSDVVSNVAGRLGSGEFTTNAAAGDAAQNLLDLSSSGE